MKDSGFIASRPTIEYNEQKLIGLIESWQEHYKSEIVDVLLDLYYAGKLDIGNLIDEILDQVNTDKETYQELVSISKIATDFGVI